MKGLMVSIFRDNLGDCTNKGETSNKNKAYVLNLQGPFEPGPGNAKLVIVPGNIRGLLKAVPCDENGVPVPVPSGSVGYMFGGNFIYCSDSRFRTVINGVQIDYPIPVHDRIETTAHYNSYD